MNFLAHFHLAGEQHGHIIGAFLGDFVKGPLRGAPPVDWETGIKMHRAIDVFVDNHPAVQDLTKQFPSTYRRFAGIMFDVCFDYCLANNWAQFDPSELASFTNNIYRSFEDTELPSQAATQQINRYREHDVLCAMQHWETVERILAHINSRFSKPTPLAECAPALRAEIDSINSVFQSLYPELDKHLLNYRPLAINSGYASAFKT